MDIQRKSIQELTISLDEKRDELSSLYRSFGTALLADAEDPTVPSGFVAEERVSTYRTLMSSREFDSKSILDIQDALIRKQQLKQFGRELDLSYDDEQASYQHLLEQLGDSFFDAITHDASFLDHSDEDVVSFFEKANAEKTKLTKLEDKKIVIEQESLTAGFFGKMITQVKMSALSSSLKQAQARMSVIFIDAAKTLLEKKSFLTSSKTQFPIVFSEIFEKVEIETARLEELKGRKESLLSDIESVNALLKGFDALENSQRKIKELHARITDTDKRIDSVLLLTAREYGDRFVDDNGVSLQNNEKATDESSLGPYSDFLDQISQCRKKIHEIRSSIEIIETNIKIQTLEKNIQSYTRSIADCESRITHYQETITTMRSSIIEAELEKNNLLEKVGELQTRISSE